MNDSVHHLTIVVGASPAAEELRRWLTRHGLSHISVGAHMRGLRRAMAIGLAKPAIMCVALDRPTLTRHGESLQRILTNSFDHQIPFTSIGLLPNTGLTSETAEIGCDVYVNGCREAVRTIHQVKKEWHRVRQTCGDQELERFRNLGQRSEEFGDVLSDFVPGQEDRFDYARRMLGKQSWSPLDFVD